MHPGGWIGGAEGEALALKANSEQQDGLFAPF